MMSVATFTTILLVIVASITYLGSTKRNYMLVFTSYCDIVEGEVLTITETVFDFDFKIQLSTGDVATCTAMKTYGKRVGDTVHVCKSHHCAYLLDEVLDVPGCEEILKERDMT